MKNVVLSTLCLILTLNSFSQTYEFKYGADLKTCDEFGKESGASAPVLKGWLFTIHNELADGSRIIFINKFKDDNQQNGKYYNANYAKAVVVITEEPSIFFKLTEAQFASLSQEVEGTLTFGTMVLPIKVRFRENDKKKNVIREFDFTSEINIGLSLAYRLSRRNAAYKIHAVGSIGLSTIPVDAASTNGFIKEKTNAAALTPTLGLIFTQKKSGIQVSTVCGLDYFSRDLGRNWEYRGWPWLGIGIGFSIFKLGDKGSSSTND